MYASTRDKYEAHNTTVSFEYEFDTFGLKYFVEASLSRYAAYSNDGLDDTSWDIDEISVTDAEGYGCFYTELKKLFFQELKNGKTVNVSIADEIAKEAIETAERENS